MAETVPTRVFSPSYQGAGEGKKPGTRDPQDKAIPPASKQETARGRMVYEAGRRNTQSAQQLPFG